MCFCKNELVYWLSLFPKKTPEKLNEKSSVEKRRVYLGDKYKEVYFSRRESECVYLWIRNYSRLEIASKLSLSIRTVDFYLLMAKEKINCHKKRVFIELILETEFLKNYHKAIEE